MAIYEEDLFYLSQKANAPFYNEALVLYKNCINLTLNKLKETIPEFDKDRVKIYIQGSYENDTMVDDFSKLEIVVEFPLNAFGEISKQPALKTKTLLVGENFIKKRIVKFKPIVPINYIKNQLLETILETTKNEEIIKNSKSIYIPPYKKIKISCEILPCYTLNDGVDKHAVIIFDSEIQKHVAAFPIIHCKNLKEKNQQCNGNFLKLIRIYRNIRDNLIENNIIQDGFAPQYFLECLLYNIPNQLFNGRLEQIFLKTLNYLYNCNLTKFVCAHEQFQMFGNNSDSWTIVKARTFIKIMINVWLNYEEE